jgi:hypothetical protein
MVLSIVSSVSLIISTSIEFIKDAGSETYSIKFDKVAYRKTAQSLLFDNIKKFNKSCSSGELDKSLDYVLKSGSRQLLGVTGMGIVTFIGVTGLVLCIIPILRELVFFFFNTKQSISDYFDIQADLVQMNSQYVSNDPSFDAAKRKSIVKRQDATVKSFRKISNALAIDNKKAEDKAKKDSAAASKKKYKVNDVVKDEKLDSAPDLNGDSSSSLF